MIASTVIRASSEACGSWNTICILGLRGRSRLCDICPISVPSMRMDPEVMS